jgi:GTP-binding protein HflX
LKGLLETAGGVAEDVWIQERVSRDPATLIGKGKVEEIARAVAEKGWGAVVINDDLSPTQQQNLQEHIPAKIIDRTRLILDIFAQRARTREGKLQVELAQMNYLLPRVTEKFGRFEQQVGGIGTRGPGERKLEISQRRIRDRIVRLRREIEEVRKQRALQRENRQRLPMPLVALVGYTNAGKSTLLKCICGFTDPTGGTVELGAGVKLGYFSQHSNEVLNPEKTVYDEIHDRIPTATIGFVRNLLGAFLFSGDDVYKKISVLSGGEKSRVVLASILATPVNFLVLDEPTNHLDIQSREVLMKAVQDFDGTVMVVSHDRHFLRSVSNRVFQIGDGHLQIFGGGYAEFQERASK